MLAVGIIFGCIFIGLCVFVGIYNNLVGLRNLVKQAWSQIDVQLKRRYDLIPNIVETVKGYKNHEGETLEAVIKARNVAVRASSANASIAERGKIEGELSNALSRLAVVVESYPDLKASANFLALQEELSATENKISFSREYYNDSVLAYNNTVQMFPSNIIANMAHFVIGEFFQVAETEKVAPKVSFS